MPTPPNVGRQYVRAAIDDYIQAGIQSDSDLPGFATFFPHPPKITDEGDFVVAGEDPGHSMGTVAYLWIGKVVHKRLATGGPTSGNKAAIYPCVFICFTRSTAKLSQDCGIANDIFVDGLRAYIEASRTAGTSIGVPAPTGTIWQWGEGTHFGQEDIEEDFTMPRSLAKKLGVTQVFGTLSVIAMQTYYS